MSNPQESVTESVPIGDDEKDLSNEPELETEESDDETYQEVSLVFCFILLRLQLNHIN